MEVKHFRTIKHLRLDHYYKRKGYVKLSWIEIIDIEGATGTLKEVYENIERKRGKVGNILKIHSLYPESMQAHLDLYVTIMFGKSVRFLSREERELIALTVSITNFCKYCIQHHAEALNYYWKDRDKLKNYIKDVNSLDCSKRLRSILNYSIKLTKTPHLMNKEDIQILQTIGLTDKEILNVNLITCYFNFVNRIASGLGVEFDESEIKGYKY